MAEREIPITVVVRTLDEDLLFAEAILFPELCLCDRKLGRVRKAVRDLARKVAEKSPNFTLHRRYLPGDATVESAAVTLSPTKKRPAWDEPVSLKFHVIRWRHGADAWLAFVPALGIEVVASREPDLQRMIPEHILAALRRTKVSESLFALALTQQNKEVTLLKLSLPVSIKSPKQLQQDEDKEEEKRPVIDEVGLGLQSQVLKPAHAVDTTIDMLADAINSRIPRSVLLVGPSGVGKTAAVHELVRRRDALGLGNRPFWATSGSRLIAGMSGFGMWQKRSQRLCKEAKDEGAILHLGNLVELMEVGRSGGGQGLAGFLRPYLARGEVVAIAECTPEQLPLIERENPHLLEIFRQLRMEEPTPAAGREILLNCALASGRPRITATDPWLDTLDRLHRRYATYSAYPGRPIRFLENLLKDKPSGESPESSEVIAAFSRETGLPRFMLDPAMPLDLVAAREWFTHRVIGQERAVDLVVDLLATVKAALTRPRRPIASLLFIGPTGVGKTELAKALAEYFFGDRSRLTRFDMSEFATSYAVERLIGGAFGAEGLLTAKVREQPFSVILFDEFEKAHWGFFDLLLQALGEGRLTDAAGRVGDFSNAIVVMTSNLGAEAFGRGTFGLTTGPGHPDPERHFTDEVRAFLRPELFNRIDRIVPFMPLDALTIGKIADRELSLTRQRDGFNLRGLTLNLTDAATRYLSEKGYDVRYGARPLKRAIERELLAPLAEAVNGYPADLRLNATADATVEALNVIVKPQVDSAGKTASIATSASGLAIAAQDCVTFRRDVQKLERCAALLAVQNQLFLLEREERRSAAREKPSYDAVRAEEIKQLKAIADPAAAVSKSIRVLEDEVLTALYESEGGEKSGLRDRLSPLTAQFDELLLALLARQVSKPHSVTLAVYGDKLSLWDLVRAYYTIAADYQFSVQLHWFSRFGPDALRRHRVEDAAAFLAEIEPKAIGMAMGISGQFAALRFTPEEGIHSFVRDGIVKLCQVDTSDSHVNEYEPPARVEFPDVPAGSARRAYNLDTGYVDDSLLPHVFTMSGRNIKHVVVDAMGLQLRQAARGILE